ncbi:alpha/beta fold hydrolase [Prescottella defluvii]|uniref:alpha/beta fold hydrolase n=1 Tax=Prescottella defluvii TaxID=1323361 RepID=UPI0009DEA1A5|nr:alpha/beta fold hydrolase [Prescottella defluvii]
MTISHEAGNTTLERPTVVLLHSLGTDRTLWRHQVPALSPHYRVLTPESRGHGESPWFGSVSIDEWTADLRALIEPLGAVHLVGLSMGGIQSIAFAAAHPELVRSVVIANSFARLPIDVADARVEASTRAVAEEGMAAFAKEYLDQTLTRELDQADYAALLDSIAGVAPDAYLGSVEATFRADVIPMLEKVTCPSMVVVGDRDAKIPAARTAEIVDGLGGAPLEVIPDAGHLSCIENPTRFNQVIAGFLNLVDDNVSALR